MLGEGGGARLAAQKSLILSVKGFQHAGQQLGEMAGPDCGEARGELAAHVTCKEANHSHNPYPIGSQNIW